jgi:hypothetical protein
VQSISDCDSDCAKEETTGEVFQREMLIERRLTQSHQILKLRKHVQQTIQEKHHEFRQEELEQLQSEYLTRGEARAAERVESKPRHEKSRQDWRLIRNTMNPKQRSGFLTLEVPDKDNQGRETDDPDKPQTRKTISNPKEINE